MFLGLSYRLPTTNVANPKILSSSLAGHSKHPLLNFAGYNDYPGDTGSICRIGSLECDECLHFSDRKADPFHTAQIGSCCVASRAAYSQEPAEADGVSPHKTQHLSLQGMSKMLVSMRTNVLFVAAICGCVFGRTAQAQYFYMPSQGAGQMQFAALNEGYDGSGLDGYAAQVSATEADGDYCESGCCDTDCCDTGCCDSGCDSCCGMSYCDTGCSGVQVWVDATVLRFHKTGGVRVGNDLGEDAELGYFVSPRFNFRYYNPRGMYVQASYFNFNHGTLLSANDPGSHIGVRSWTLDLVAGERFMLNRDWAIDWNAGARLYDYSEMQTDANEVANNNTEYTFNHSWGIGGIVGLEASRMLGKGWSVYGGAKFGIVQGDHTVIYNRNATAPVNRRFLDENFIQTELFSGVEYSRHTVGGIEMIAKLGFEWITYENASTSYIGLSPANAEHRQVPGADVGYGGPTLSLGFYR